MLAGVIGNAFRLFLEKVAPDLLCDGFEDRLRATWPDYLNYPIAMSFPPDCDTVPASLQDISKIHQATFEEMLPRNRA